MIAGQKMLLKYCSLTFFLFLITGKANSSTHSQCCDAGRKAGQVVNGHSSCLQKPAELSNPTKMCSSLFRVCCWVNERDGACRNGIKYSRMFDKEPSFACTESAARNTMHGSTFLECCECCQMGKLAAMKNMTCKRDHLPVNETCGQTYHECCTAHKKAKNGPTTCAEIDCDHNCQESSKGPACFCRSGFRLANDTKSCNDINECTEGLHKCMRGFKCKNLIGSYRCNRKVFKKKCRKGYKFERGVCRDIDECAAGTANCEAGTVCENVLGSFLCTKKSQKKTCSPGYHAVGVRCIDLNECVVRRPCPRGQRCVNTYGSFYCTAISRSCPKGYGWNETLLSCRDIDECKANPCKKDGEECRNTYGSFRCVCKRGFTKKNRRCQDRDECKLYGGRLCNQKCTNLPGSYRCDCNEGFKLAKNKRTCLDSNECLKKDICQSGETCFNLPGSHKCIKTACPRYYSKKSSRSCKLDCSSGQNCLTMPVSVKWFAVSRRGPIKKFSFRLIYDVNVDKIPGVRKVVFEIEKGNEKKTFGLQKYGYSRVIIYNLENLKSSKHYHLKIVGNVVRDNNRIVKFHYNLYIFIYVPN